MQPFYSKVVSESVPIGDIATLLNIDKLDLLALRVLSIFVPSMNIKYSLVLSYYGDSIKK